MENLPRYQASRKAHRSHLTRTYSKLREILETEEELSDSQLATLNTALDKLERKRLVLLELDEKIAEAIQEPDELESEVLEAEDIQDSIYEMVDEVKRFLSKLSVASTVAPPSSSTEPQTVDSENVTVPSNLSATAQPFQPQTVTVEQVGLLEDSQVSRPSHNPMEQAGSLEDVQVPHPPQRFADSLLNSASSSGHVGLYTSQSVSRLPKLSLPTFSGDPLSWQTFWDSFRAAVDSNPTLSGVQKFNYLKAQLRGDAARAVAGFPLTDCNYKHSTDILQERFGQTHTIVKAHMQALVDLPSPDNTFTDLRSFYDSVEGHIRGLSSLGKSQEKYGDLLIPIIQSKIPAEVRQNLAREHSNSEWNIDELRSAILKEIRILEQGLSKPTPFLPDTSIPGMTAATFFTGAQDGSKGGRNKGGYSKGGKGFSVKKPIQAVKRLMCTYCKGSHTANNCDAVKDCDKRWEIVKKERLCFNCLAHHRVSECDSKQSCKLCGHRHHTSLCRTSVSSSSNDNTSVQVEGKRATTQNPSSESKHSLLSSTHSQIGKCLLKTAIARVSVENRCAKANILFDEGAQRSFISQQLADSLSLHPKHTENIHISSFGAESAENKQLSVAVVNVEVLTGEKIPVSGLIVPSISTPLHNSFHVCVKNIPHLQGLILAHPITGDEHFEISLLIGADQYWNFVGDHIVRGDGPTAMQSKLGYLISGPLPVCQTQFNDTNVFHVSIQDRDDGISFWSMEAAGIEGQTNPTVDFLSKFQESSITQEKDGGYTVKFPWKQDHPPLPTNFAIAERRTRSLARKLKQAPELLEMYGNIIAEQERRGFVEKVPTSISTSGKVHYIPHHAVHKDSSTTPIRIVYDCSCRQSDRHPSLNDCLLVGPPQQNDLCAILLRFRCHAIGLSTDIEKAFLHVGLDETDRDYTRFLWLSDPKNSESDFQTYCFKSVLFGSASSPFMLNATLQYHLDKFKSPMAVDMKDNLYVDNIISGVSEEMLAIKYYKEARSIMKQAKFNLRSWASNSNQVQALAMKDGVADMDSTVNILGLRWNLSCDTITFALKSIAPGAGSTITKREVLQQSSRLYDPLGFLAPVTVQAKILLQELWQLKIKWDDPLNDSHCMRWQDLSCNIEESMKMELPRQFFTTTVTKPELHVFADASIKAYGAVAYLCAGKQSSFIVARTRVAPLKTQTLPRLELMAATIAKRLANFICSSLNSTYECLSVQLWSDSQIVLHWLNSNKKLKPFVASRITEITGSFPASKWKYCPTADNPADLLTRGISADSLADSKLWRYGPVWLGDPTKWPVWNNTEVLHLQVDGEDERDCNSEKTQPPESGLSCIINPAEYNSLDKLIGVTAYVLRFAHNARSTALSHSRQSGPLSPQECTNAQLMWIRNCQQRVYHKELVNLTAQSASRLTLIRQLRLFLDSNQIIRCGGRIHNAPISELARFPYLLPKSHPFTTLVVKSVHIKQFHAGTNSTVTAIRQHYWIPAARQCVKKVISKCVTCRKHSGAAYKAPDPPPLPKSRVQRCLPFTTTGVDFTGALYVKGRGSGEENKVYICLFTCAVTRAVHLEVVTDLTEATFLEAFRRFVGRRSLPQTMISDNASTYLSAADELIRLFESTTLKEALGRRGVQWQFIPKRGPWFGGFWERLIGLTKNAIKKVLGRAFVSLSTLQTMIIEVEAHLNNRPITYVSSEFDDPDPLTPAHLLYGRSIVTLPHLPVEEDELTDPDYEEVSKRSEITKRAKVQARLLQHFWKRWKNDYLTSLREFHMTSGNNHQVVKIGDVVLVHDDTPRNKWRLAVIEGLDKGYDGLVRAAHIRTSSGKTNRPIVKLYPLEITAQEQDTDPIQGNTSSKSQTSTKNSDATIRPVRKAAQKACQRIAQWADQLCPPGSVKETEEHTT